MDCIPNGSKTTFSNNCGINFENFIKKNSNKIITYDQALAKINNNLFYKMIRFLTTKVLKLKRMGLKKETEYNIKEA